MKQVQRVTYLLPKSRLQFGHAPTVNQSVVGAKKMRINSGSDEVTDKLRNHRVVCEIFYSEAFNQKFNVKVCVNVHVCVRIVFFFFLVHGC